jgi:lysophospholipase L1-like esterase
MMSAPSAPSSPEPRADPILPAAAARPRPSFRRKLLFSLLLFLLFVGLAEVVARVADARLHFHHQVVRALDDLERLDQPQPRPVLDWPDRGLWIRLSQDRPKDPRVFDVGGRMIPDADPTRAVQGLLMPEGIPPDPPKSVFIVGGSAAFGYLYAYGDTFAGRLEARLAPKGYRVINAAEVGQVSAHFVPVVQRIIDHYRPDAIVFFLGNNEWKKWALHDRSGGAWKARLHRLLANSRALAAIQYLVLRNAGTQREGSRELRLDFSTHRTMGIADARYTLEHPLEDAVSFEPDELLRVKETFLDAFEENLHEMVRIARQRAVRVILLTVPFNYKLSPAWNHEQPESYKPESRDLVRGHIREAALLIRSRQYSEALKLMDEALAADPLPPILHYQRAQALEGLGRPVEAEEAYAQSREHMIGHLGHRLSINERIRNVARETDAELIDVRTLFDDDQHAQGRYFNQDLIHDDCHPTPLGHRIITDALAEKF